MKLFPRASNSCGKSGAAKIGKLIRRLHALETKLENLQQSTSWKRLIDFTLYLLSQKHKLILCLSFSFFFCDCFSVW